jgi:hypothetical protein
VTITYLQLTASAQVDINGNALAMVKPDTGQFWAISLITVATGITPNNTALANQPLCTLYRGSTGALQPVPLSTNYLDDTAIGGGDTSSIISGTIVSMGEGIAAQWKSATQGDTALLTIYGRSSDSLVELQSSLSPVPGARFSGNSGNLMVWEYNDQTLPGPASVGSATAAKFTVPFNLLVELVCVQYVVTTTAAVQNRNFGVFASVFDGTQFVRLFTANAGQPQGATSVCTYSYWPGANSYLAGVPAGLNIGGPLPAKTILPSSAIVQLYGLNFVAGDLWTNWSIVYRQYDSLQKVTTT